VIHYPHEREAWNVTAHARGFRKILLAGVCLVALVVASDRAVLLLIPDYHTITEADENSGYRLRPRSTGRDFSTLKGEHRITSYFIGDWGERVASPAATSALGRPLIACHGDSYTFGQGVPWEDAYPAQLARELGGRATVLNLGVPGYTAWQSGRALARSLERLNPDLVVWQLCGNDDDRENPAGKIDALPWTLLPRLGFSARLLTDIARSGVAGDPARNTSRAVPEALGLLERTRTPLLVLVQGYPPSLPKGQLHRLSEPNARFAVVEIGDLPEAAYLRSTLHFNADGNRAVAVAAAQAIRGQPWLAAALETEN